MADKMPFDVLWKLYGLGGELLGTILPETFMAGLVGFHYLFARVEFGNCHQFYFWRQFLKNPYDIIFYHSSWLAPSASGPASSGLPPDAVAICSLAASCPPKP